MRLLVGAAALLLSAGAFAAEADPRAVEACQKTSKAFTEIAKCVPNADVAFAVIDEFDRAYELEATPLKAKCIELNGDDISGASICLLNAIKDAVSLKASLPAGMDLDDPVFNAVADETRRERLLAVQEAARGKYPDVIVWGGGIYMPYR